MWLPCVDEKRWYGDCLIGDVGKMGGGEFSQSDLALSVVKYITCAVCNASFMPVQVRHLSIVAPRNAAWLGERRASPRPIFGQYMCIASRGCWNDALLRELLVECHW